MTATPVAISDRFHSLDLIRGVAVLGILLMNIALFSNVFAYYGNPMVYGEPSQADYYSWLVIHFVADQKFYTLFSILFGAGIMLMAQKASNKGVAPGPLHYKRMGWLLLFGLLHGYFIWYGDILATYALMGMWVYLFALTAQPKTKLMVAIILISLSGLMMYGITLLMDFLPAEKMTGFGDMNPKAEDIAAEQAIYQGAWIEQFKHRLMYFSLMLTNALSFAPLKIGGLMLLGMALYQKGVLTAEKSKAFYLKLTLIGLLVGGLAMALNYYQLERGEFNNQALMLSAGVINNLGSLFIALAYLGLLCLWLKSNSLVWLRQKFEAVGRMAFTNYILQSVICTTLFYGYGFGLFAELERYQLMIIAGGIFMAQLIWSDLWLKRFHFGPLEWLWRSLSYSQRQPFSRAHS